MSKRAAPDAVPTETSNAQRYNNIKRAKVGTKPLDGWLAVPPPKKPSPFGMSMPLFDRDSVFIGYAAQAESTQDINRIREYILQVANPEYRDDPASHLAHGARMLGVKSGRTGMGNLDFEVKTFSENDGEAKAGQTILDTLAKADACDVVVLVARWFGGTMLGPSRFDWIKKVAIQALHSLRDAEEVLDLQLQLIKKDDEIYNLLKDLSRKEGKAPPAPPEAQDYESIDLNKAKRLVVARDARMKALRARMVKLEKQEEEETEELPDVQGSSQG